MTFFLQLTKNIHLSDELTRKGGFQDKGSLPSFFELYQKNVLILGFGRIGQAVAKRCLGFEMNVYVYDPYVDDEKVKKLGCHSISKDEGFKIADFISIHLPLNDDTRNFINAESFQEMKDSCVVVNTARGGIINEDDLYEALYENKIRAAGLDVFEQEPPAVDHPLFKLSNVLLTPHNAALTLECRKRMAIEVCETVSFYLKNKEKLSNLSHEKDEETIKELSESFRSLLMLFKQSDKGIHFIQPGRFILPGNLDGAPVLDFYPLPEKLLASINLEDSLLVQRFNYYRDNVVKPFFKEYFYPIK